MNAHPPRPRLLRLAFVAITLLAAALACSRAPWPRRAMGTQLQNAGLESGHCGEAWNLDHPERVLAIQRRYVEAEQRVDVVSRERDQASRERDEARKMVVRQVQLCQRLLRRPVSDAAELAARILNELRDLAERLERDLTAS